ncbi:MAG TPA: DUF58 domain-containing protein [Melioribacteraceae bacterium]|nr:DUF58 domain-containing protein [Melioribacteraceae bacterium]
MDYKKFLEPSFISKLSSLEIKAKKVVEGFMVGLHKSPYHGFSVEFSQHRPYMQGDSIKNVDWKLFGKTEKFYIKQFEEETNLLSYVLLDVSKSMDFKYTADVTKFEYANTLAASLIYLLNKQRDAAGLVLYSDTIETYLEPKANKTYLKVLFNALVNQKLSGKTNTGKCLNNVAEKIKKRGMIIIISDFFDNLESVITALKHFHYKNNDVIVFHLLDRIESTFGFGRDAIFIDKETGEELTTQSSQIQKSYINLFDNFTNTLKSECLKYGMDYNLVFTDMTYDKALQSFFIKRSKLH